MTEERVLGFVTPEDFPKVVTDALAVHEAFRRLGFQSKDIYVIINWGRIFVLLKHDGKEFHWLVGPLPAGMDFVAFHGLWQEAVALWNGGWTKEECQRVWRAGPVVDHAVEFLQALNRKGIQYATNTMGEGLS